jgi:F420H(2)-dependent quinone reductase
MRKHTNEEETSTMALGSAPASGNGATDAGLASPGRAQRVPPRWIVRTIWVGHRAIHRLSGGRRGLQTPKAGKWGTMRLATVGRHTGKERSAILGYIEEGSSLVTLAMNGWGKAEPAWWLNLQAQPDVTIELRDGMRAVRARAAVGEERERLWARFRTQREWGDVDSLATRRPGETAVVIFEPR